MLVLCDLSCYTYTSTLNRAFLGTEFRPGLARPCQKLPGQVKYDNYQRGRGKCVFVSRSLSSLFAFVPASGVYVVIRSILIVRCFIIVIITLFLIRRSLFF